MTAEETMATGDWIVLLGGHKLHTGFVQLAKDWRARLAVVDWNEHPAVAGDHHIRLDIKATGEVLDAVRFLQGRLMFAYTSADVAAETAAQLNAAAGLARAPSDAIARARNKAAMNEAWSAAGLIGKRFHVCRTAGELRAFALDLGSK